MNTQEKLAFLETHGIVGYDEYADDDNDINSKSIYRAHITFVDGSGYEAENLEYTKEKSIDDLYDVFMFLHNRVDESEDWEV